MPRTEMNVTRAKLHALCKPKKSLDTPRANLNRDPCKPLSTVRVELSMPRATLEISAHASRTLVFTQNSNAASLKPKHY